MACHFVSKLAINKHRLNLPLSSYVKELSMFNYISYNVKFNTSKYIQIHPNITIVSIFTKVQNIQYRHKHQSKITFSCSNHQQFTKHLEYEVNSVDVY